MEWRIYEKSGQYEMCWRLHGPTTLCPKINASANMVGIFPYRENFGSVKPWYIYQFSGIPRSATEMFLSSGVIWSSGYLSDEIRASPSNQYLSVRGPVSRLLLCLQTEYLQWTPEVSGDSALLLPLLYHPGNNVTRTTELCIVLHFSDEKLKEFMARSKDVSPTF